MGTITNLLSFIFDVITGCVGSEEFTSSILVAPFVFLLLKYIIDFFKALTRSL